MTDATRLTHLLEDYAESLAGHLASVREEFDQLTRAWRMLSDVYEGDAAEQFRGVFEATAARMRHYEEDAGVLLGVLRGRIESLRRFDAVDGAVG